MASEQKKSSFDAEQLRQALTGVCGILVTPFNADGELAVEKQKPIVDRAIAAGVHTLVANGNTGEYYALTDREAEAMANRTAEHIGGRVPFIGGVGRSIDDAIRLARASVAASADAIMIHQPPDPFVAPRGLVDYVKRVRDSVDGTPVILYLRNDAIGTDCIAGLCSVDGVIGVKWATPNPLKLSNAIAACDPSIAWVGGLAETWAPAFYACGARGFTSGLINIWPERSVAINVALEAGNMAEARHLISEMQVFEDIRAEDMGGSNVSGVKLALALTGLDCGAARPPSAWPLLDEQARRLAGFLSENDLMPGELDEISGLASGG
jgi:4-hydroxy-tetrahydrodipicolinate synthase